MWLKRAVLLFGVLLLIASVPVLWLQAREEYFERRARERYRVNAIERSTAAVDERIVVITPTQIVVGPQNFPRLVGSDAALVRLVDTTTGEIATAAVERSGGDSKESWRYRIILADSSGDTVVDEFGFRERNERPYRVLIAQYASPEMIGFTNESLTYWPGLLYPMLYPWATAIVGVIAVIAAARKRQTAPAT